MKKYLLAPMILFVAAFASHSCGTDLDDNLTIVDPSKVIHKDSELFAQLTKVTTASEDPLEEIVCIDFIYPFQVIVYDVNLQQLDTRTLTGDDDFSQFLGELPDDQSISISYPISTTLEDGTVWSVNNNSELKLAIDSCSREDIISYYSDLFSTIGDQGQAVECYWEVDYYQNADNQYVSGVFKANFDGTLAFMYNDTTYLGTWVFLFVNDELHINMNLQGTSPTATDWNIDRKVMVIGETMKIINPPTGDVFLQKTCEETDDYAIGDVGPAGGIVSYDKGTYTNGWRYIETAQTDLGYFEWGCLGSQTQSGSNAAIGKGLFNTAAVVNYHDSLDNYYTNPGICNALNNGTVSAQKAIIYNEGGLYDWFLPSSGELSLLYANLHQAGLGGFSDTVYWSSTETDAGHAKGIDFGNGNTLDVDKIPAANTVQTRVVRYF